MNLCYSESLIQCAMYSGFRLGEPPSHCCCSCSGRRTASFTPCQLSIAYSFKEAATAVIEEWDGLIISYHGGLFDQ